MPKLTFSPKYFFLSIGLFLSEISIELFAHDSFIRPYFGDYLVVILLYSIIRSFLKLKTIAACLFVLGFSFFLEFAQYFKILELFELQDVYAAKILLGNSFSIWDLAAYFLGVITIYFLEIKIFDKK